MVHYAIAKRRGRYKPPLGLVNIKLAIGFRPVRPLYQFAMQALQFEFQPVIKARNVWLHPFAAPGLAGGEPQVLKITDRRIEVSVSFHRLVPWAGHLLSSNL